jgi:ribonucleotide reductase alpha subunit
LVPFLRVFNDIARWIDQGGKRPGSIAIYLEPHHPDIFEFLELRKNFGEENLRARDLFLALWISDLFMKQVESDGDWYLLSADECEGLTDAYGDAYEQLYWKYVNENKYRVKTKARKIWTAMMDSQIETGLPYIGFKDSVNHKSNQKNLGTIKSSNLCIEIVQYSDDKEYAVCNLASIALKPFVKNYKPESNESWIIYTKPNCQTCNFAKEYLANENWEFEEREFSNETLAELKKIVSEQNIIYPQILKKNNDSVKLIGTWADFYKYTAGTFNWSLLYDAAYTATENLNQVIDINFYPVPQTKFSNMRHRPIGLGIQGLADALVMMRIPFESEEYIDFNKKMMETIYRASVTASTDLAMERTEPMTRLIKYLNQNQIICPDYYQNDLVLEDEDMNKIYHQMKPNIWELRKNPETDCVGAYSSFEGSPMSEGKFQFDMWNHEVNTKEWEELKVKVKKYGLRNSQLTALMPTASTSQILGNNECFEFFTNNIYTRKTQAGDFVLVNKYLVNDLIKIGAWSPELKDMIIASNGSILQLENLPIEFKNLYKTVWEIKQVWVLKGALARAPFVDQTQSMNIFMAQPDYQRLSSSHFWAWKNGLKTGMYYLRSKPAAEAIKFTVDAKLTKQFNETVSQKPESPKTKPRIQLSHPEEDSNHELECTNCSA